MGIKSYCGICPAGCECELEVVDGKLVSMRKPAGKSGVCIRGVFSEEIVYAKDRLKTPLIRNGPKGTLSFREGTWEEAMDRIEVNIRRTMERYGPTALMSHYGRGAFEQGTNDFLGRSNPNALRIPGFFEPLGSPNNASVGSLCYTAFGVFAPVTTLGIYGDGIVPDLEHADLVLIWGTNPDTNSPPGLSQKLVARQKKGTELICIDHYLTSFAKKCDEAQMIRSGTDGILALGIIKAIIENRLYDEDFVRNWCYGFNELQEYVNSIAYDTVESHTGIDRSRIQDLAVKLAANKRSTLLTYTGIEYSNSGVQTIRSLYIIWALLGYIDTEGTLLLREDSNLQYTAFESVAVEPIGAEEFPVFVHLLQSPQFMCFPKAVLEESPYPIRFLLNIGSSILTSYPGSQDYRSALAALDYFVDVDRFLTEDALYADVVLPAATYYEVDSYLVSPTMILPRRKVIDPYFEAKGDMEILRAIANRFGYGSNYPVTMEEIADALFLSEEDKASFLRDGVQRESAETVYRKYEIGRLRIDGQPGFSTPTRKIEFLSTILERFGYDGLPVYKTPKYNIFEKEGDQAYPLTMNTGARISSKFRSQFLNISSLLKYHPKPLVLMNPQDAQERGIADGDPILLVTEGGKVPYWAKVTEDLPRFEVEVQMGGGSLSQVVPWKNADLNRIVDAKNQDEISGFPCFKALICEIVKDESRREEIWK